MNSKPEIQNSKLNVRHPALAAVAVLGALILVAFGASRNFAMLKFDSAIYILEDHAIRAVDGERITHIFSSYFFSNYNPLQRISYMLDYALWGTDPAGYRGTNFLLHWIAASLVFLFFYELTSRASVAWTTSLVFALHPTRVESVVWLAERKDVLAAAFGFAALWMYVKAKGKRQKAKGKSSESQVEEDSGQTAETQNSKLKTQNSEGNSQFSILNYTLCVLLYAGALASKAQWVPLCAIFVVIDLYARRTISWRVVAGYVPFFLLSLLFAWLAVDSQLLLTGQGMQARVTFREWVTSPLMDMVFYVRHVFWPVNLCPRYPKIAAAPWQLPVAIGLVGGCGVAGVRSWKRNREVFLGISWFFLFLAPMLNLVPGILVPVDRYLYVSILGVVIPFAMLLDRQPIRVLIGTLSLLCLGMIGLSWRYLPAWKDDLSLWSHTVEQFPNDPYAVTLLMRAQVEQGQYRAARTTYEHGLASRERYLELYEAASQLARKTGGDPGEPLRLGLKTARYKSALMALYGKYWLEEKNYTEAETWLLAATSQSYGTDTHFELAQVYQAVSQPEKGIPHIAAFLNTHVYHPKAWLILGALKEQLARLQTQRGELKEAAADLEEAKTAYLLSAQCDPSPAEAYTGLARLAGLRQNWNEALIWLAEMRAGFKGGSFFPAESYDIQAAAYSHQGKRLPALVALTESVHAQDAIQTWINLAHLQAEMGRDPRKAIEHVLTKEPPRRAELMMDPVLAPFL